MKDETLMQPNNCTQLLRFLKVSPCLRRLTELPSRRVSSVTATLEEKENKKERRKKRSGNRKRYRCCQLTPTARPLSFFIGVQHMSYV